MVSRDGRVGVRSPGGRRAASAAVDHLDEWRILALCAVPAAARIRALRTSIFRRRVQGILQAQPYCALHMSICCPAATGLARLVRCGHQVGEGDIGRTPDWSRTRWRQHSEVATPRSVVLWTQYVAIPTAVRLNRVRLAPRCAGLATILPPSLEQNTTLLGTVGRRRSEAPVHGRQPPLLDIGLDEDEARLSKVDVHNTRPVGAYGREEILGFEPVRYVFQPLTVARVENGARPGPVANADHVPLNVLWGVRSRVEGLIKPPDAIREVRYRVFVEAFKEISSCPSGSCRSRGSR